MFNISHFFNKLQNSFTKEIFIRSVIREAMKKQTGADIPIEQISVKSGVIFLKNVNSSARAAIFMKKQAILSEIEAANTGKTFTDLR